LLITLCGWKRPSTLNSCSLSSCFHSTLASLMQNRSNSITAPGDGLAVGVGVGLVVGDGAGEGVDSIELALSNPSPVCSLASVGTWLQALSNSANMTSASIRHVEVKNFSINNLLILKKVDEEVLLPFLAVDSRSTVTCTSTHSCDQREQHDNLPLPTACQGYLSYDKGLFFCIYSAAEGGQVDMACKSCSFW